MENTFAKDIKNDINFETKENGDIVATWGESNAADGVLLKLGAWFVSAIVLGALFRSAGVFAIVFVGGTLYQVIKLSRYSENNKQTLIIKKNEGIVWGKNGENKMPFDDIPDFLFINQTGPTARVLGQLSFKYKDKTILLTRPVGVHICEGLQRQIMIGRSNYRDYKNKKEWADKREKERELNQ